MDPQTHNIINTLNLDLNETKVTGDRGFSPEQEADIVRHINRFAKAARDQYESGDYEGAYSDMCIYVTAKNKLYGNIVDNFDLINALYDIHQYFKGDDLI